MMSNGVFIPRYESGGRCVAALKSISCMLQALANALNRNPQPVTRTPEPKP